MSDRNAVRLGGASGILYSALLFSTSFISNDGLSIRIAIVGLVLFVPFLVCLWSVLRRTEGESAWLSTTALAAGLVHLAIRFGSGAIEIAEKASGTDSGVRHALGEATNGAFMLSMVPLALVAASTALAAIRHAALPRSLGWLSAVTAGALFTNGLFIYSDPAPAFILFLLWTAIAGGVLIRRKQTQPAAALGVQPVPAR